MARTRMHHWSDPASFEEGKQAATFFIDPRWNKVQQIWNKSAEKSEISASCAHFHRKKSLQKVLSPKKKTRVVQVLYYKWQGKFKCSMQQWKRALCPGSTQHSAVMTFCQQQNHVPNNSYFSQLNSLKTLCANLQRFTSSVSAAILSSFHSLLNFALVDTSCKSWFPTHTVIFVVSVMTTEQSLFCHINLRVPYKKFPYFWGDWIIHLPV